MALPININDLIHGQIIEWDRLEYKEGWNPESILHTICAFANDINNWGGGYIIVGVKEIDGVPQFPPIGIPKNQIDKIQGELVSICYRVQPNYLPISQPYQINDTTIMVIWVPAGDLRPYSCPSTLSSDARRQYYIRSGSRSIIAKGENQLKLIELTARIPYDDRINQEARISDLDLGLIREFLQEIRSDLFSDSIKIPFEDLCRQMQIARGPVEFLRPVNVGLLFFNKAPHLFFNRAWIEMATHEDNSGRKFISKTLTGPLHHQVRNCMGYLKRDVIKTETKKVTGQAESVTVSNYPYNALEEAIVNAVYHKSYAEQNPIEIQVFDDCITILSYPGPMPPITNLDLKKRQVVARNYRNRRIGDFLKDLNLTEGKATGFPLIRNEMKRNGSPEPIFYTDEERITFLVTFPVHPDFINKSFIKNSDQETTQETTQETLKLIKESFLRDVYGLNERYLRDKYGIKVLDLLLALHENPNLTIPKLSELTSHSSSTIEKLLARLKSDEVITRKGSRKTGYWEIIFNK